MSASGKCSTAAKREGRSGSGRRPSIAVSASVIRTGASLTISAPNVDADRDRLTADLTAAKVVASIYDVTGIGPTIDGRNGGGDLYYTDGEIKISVLVDGCAQRAATTTVLPDPPLVQLKNRAWSAVESILQAGPSEPASPADGAQ